MTDDDKLLVESLRGGETTALGRGYAADRIEALTAENERLRNEMARILLVKQNKKYTRDMSHDIRF